MAIPHQTTIASFALRSSRDVHANLRWLASSGILLNFTATIRNPPLGGSRVKSKIGALIFFLLLLVAAFGLISFSAEFFLGKPLVKVVQEVLFMLNRKE